MFDSRWSLLWWILCHPCHASLADAFLLLKSWWFSWRMHALPVTWVSPLGKCFVVDVVEDRVISLGWMLCRYGYSFSIGNSCVDVFFFLTG